MIVNVGVASTTVVDCTSVDGGIDTVIVSSADMTYAPNAGNVIVTTVSLVRATAADVNRPRTTAFHPVASDCVDVSPKIKNVVI